MFRNSESLQISSVLLAGQRKKIVTILSIVIAIFSLIFFLLNLKYNDPLSLITIGILFIGSIGCLLLALKNHVPLSATLLTALVLVAVTASVFDSDGLFDPGIIGFLLVILIAGLTIGKLAVIPATIGSISAVIFIAWAQYRHIIKPTIRPQDGDNWLPISLLMIFSGISVWLIIRQLEANSRHVETVQMNRIRSLGTLIRGFSHEMSTPLGNARMVMSGKEGKDDSIDDPVEIGILNSAIEKNVTLLNRMKHFLDTAENSPLFLFNISDRIKLISCQFKDLTIPEEIPDKEFNLRWDAVGMILEELIDNALRHADGLLTELTVKEDKGGLIFVVSNNGSPVGKIDKNRLYEPFYTTERSIGHAGLGLYFAQYLAVTVLRGKIEDSRLSGDKCVFTLRIPLN